jgi:hypothetical protein
MTLLRHSEVLPKLLGDKSGDRRGHGNNSISSSSKKAKKLEQYVGYQKMPKITPPFTKYISHNPHVFKS